MTKEQEKAIEHLEELSNYCALKNIDREDSTFGEFVIDIQKIKNLIQTQQQELEKKDKLYKKAIKGLIKANKIINSMANELIKNNIHKKYCYYVAGSTECSHNCRECVKEIIGGNVK